MVRWLILAIFFTLAGCESQQSSDVQINTSGVFTPVSISYSNQELAATHDFGEYLIGTGAAIYTLTVRNNSLFPITELNLTLESFEAFGFGFEKTEDGKTKYPGKSGTCGTTLNPAQSCTISLQFETNISKLYVQPVTFKYLNYIEAASKEITLKVLAGNPASLVFENEITNYFFGEQIGMAQVPVIERDLVQEYSQVLKVTNAGDLKARNLTNNNIILTQSCNSAHTKACPAGQNTAYRITHNCPTELKHAESCNITLYFKPLNQANTDEMKKIRYDSVLKLNYKTSLQGGDASLNGYITTNSVNIEAWFETSIDSQIFENTIVVGNRDIRSFRVNNRGYRSGYMRKIVFKDLGGTHIASCAASVATAPWLECYDESMAIVQTLAQFPFKLKDKNDCLGDPFDTGKIIPVDQGCQFDIQFQPSITFDTAKIFNYEIFAEFDSQWKGESTIREGQLHTLTAQSIHAAKIIPITISYNNAAIPVESGTGTPLVLYNAGRVGLMSPSNFKRRPLMVTFKNVGGVAATSIVAKDGQATPNIIPQKEDNPTGVAIGVSLPKYFINSLINTNNCYQIEPGASCTIQTSFAPVSLGTWETNAQNMFDVIYTNSAGSPNYLDSYKQFIMTYQDGTTYTDTNTLTTTSDSGANLGEARLKVDLVEKGQLDDYSSLNIGMNQQTQGTNYRRELTFSNIGTKEIPYIYYTGDKKLTALDKGVKVIPTDPAKLDADTLDCYNLIDFYYTAGDSLATINARSHLWDPLPIGKNCIMTLEYFSRMKSFTDDDTKSKVSMFKEISRNTYSATNNTVNGWDWEQGSNVDFKFQLDAYDGDLTDPAAPASGPYGSTFGKFMLGKQVNAGGQYKQPAKIIPYAPKPMASSILFRPGWNRPSVTDELGATFITASPVPDQWFFSDYTESTTAFTGYDADFYKGILAKNFFPNGMTLPNLADYEFVYYMGTVPSNIVLNGALTLANTGFTTAFLKSTTINTILRPNPLATTQNFTTSLTGIAYPKPVNPVATITASTITTGFPTSYSFSAVDEGVYAAELVINYEDGMYTTVGPYKLPITLPDPRTLREAQRKILIVAEISNAVPELKLDVQDYDVTTDDLNPAVESLGAVVTTPMSYHENNSTVLSFTSIKIPSPARKDSFIKKRFTFYNPSATTAIEDVKLFFRMNAMSPTKDALNAPTNFYLCWTGSQTNAALAAVNGGGVAQPMCTGTCGTAAFNLAPGGSCYIELRYQPTGTAVAKSVTLTALHKVGTDRYIHRNLDMNFTPQSPATVAITNRTPQVIRVNAGTVSSYNVDFGAPIQTSNPMVFTYNGPTTGGWNKMFQFNNPTTTKASFLKSYQVYYKQFIDPLITDGDLKTKVPAYPADYTMDVGGVLFTLIHQVNYPSTTNPRIQVWSNKECLIGDDTGLWFQKGFTGATTCKMIPILFADINYINRTLNVNLAADMEPNYVRLQYYSANRTSTAALGFHFTGSMKPNTVTVGSPNGINYYQNVATTSANNGEVTFKWTEMTPTTPSLGPIVGYRIYFSTTSSPVNAVFPVATTQYLDTPVNGTGIYQLTHSNLGLNRYMYYRIFPIRQNAAYTHAPNPFGLPIGRYLSNPNVPLLPVVVPNANFIYQHAGRYLIERGVYDPNMLTHAAAKLKCSSRVKHSITVGASIVQYSYLMVKQAIWDVILSRPDSSNYNLNDYPLWLDVSSVNIHTKLLSNPQYVPSQDMAYLDQTMIFYIKKSGCGTNCTGNTAVGNAFGQPGYTSYIEPTINFAGARCYIQLP